MARIDSKANPQWSDEGDYKQPSPSSDNIRVPKLEVDNATTYIDKDGSNNMTFTDAVSGTKTLAQLAAGGDVATDAIWDAKGDLAVGSGADAAAKLTVGSDNQVLRVATDTPTWEDEFDATVPSTQAFGDAAATGTAATAARRDHKHAMMANPVTGHESSYDHTKIHTQNTDTGTSNATFAINGSNAIVEGDARLTDSRTPTSHGNEAHSSTFITATPTQVITDNNVLTVDDASAADNDLCYFTANGIEGVAITGATLPASHSAGQFFCHAPTGRKIVYVSDGTNWNSLISIGTMTLYVDATDGTDDTAHGTAADASAFATVQYAIDTIPGLVGGNVTINVNGETFAETVTIQGKNFTGNYSISIYGTLTQSATATQDSSVQGSGATQGSITDTGAFGSYDNYLLYSSNNTEYRLIDSDDVNTATIAGAWSAAPSGTYTVYDWGTVINKVVIGDTQKSVYLYNIHFNTYYSANFGKFCQSTLYRCKMNGFYNASGNASFVDCYVYSDSIGGDITQYGVLVTTRTKVYVTGDNDICIRVYDSGVLTFGVGSICDAGSKTGTVGIQCWGNSAVGCWATVYDRIRNLGTGIYAYGGAQVTNTGNNQYTNNTANETATAASYGYID